MVNKLLNRKKLNPLVPIFTGNRYEEEVSIQLFTYNNDRYVEDPLFSEDKFTGFTDQKSQYWLNFHGLHDVELIKRMCQKLGIHNLAIQDILDTNQRPKFQEYDDHWFFSLKSILPSCGSEIESEQISFILGRNFLVSFQERKADYFEHLRHRLREKVGLLRERGPDLLLYSLLESILDNYFKTIDSVDKQVDEFGFIDMDVDPSPNVLRSIEHFKRQIHLIKKTISPIKEFVAKIEREEYDLISHQHIKYYYELKDLCLTLLDNCDSIEVRLESSTNLFFSVQGHRMNQVMKTLTVVATIFIPLTFIAGIYGMNFTNMPELTWKWGYFALWLTILAIFGFMLFYFRKKRWF
ncbi:MAG: magnesium/cobalt transporter CorA [Bacteroidales bacterium]|nr:magnesium/cobalt transporter CorA [Bacteroidales bacterium]